MFPVNPKAEVVQSVRAHPTVLDIPNDVDMAVVVVPASAVTQVAEQSAGKRGKGFWW